MNDLIRRQDAIDLLKFWADGYNYIEVETAIRRSRGSADAAPAGISDGTGIQTNPATTGTDAQRNLKASATNGCTNKRIRPAGNSSGAPDHGALFL